MTQTSDFIMIGAPFADLEGPDNGQVFTYKTNQSGSGWEINVLDEPEMLNSSSNFGASIAITESFAIIGAPNQSVKSRVLCGMAFLYQVVDTTWTVVMSFVPNGQFLRSNARFGWSVAISGNSMTVLIGAPDLNNSGFVTVYSSGNWLVPIHVTASDGGVDARFGSSISTCYNGSWFVVGAHWADYTTGSVYVFNQTTLGTINQVALIHRDGTSDFSDFFGAVVQMSFTGETFMVGMTPSNLPGKVFVYEFDHAIGRFTCRTTLSEPSPEIASNRFASSIALAPDGKSAIVGAPYKEIGTAVNAGAVFKFDRISQSSWNLSQTFENPDATDDNFGTGLAYNGNTFVCGATGQNSSCGLSYIWTFVSTTTDLIQDTTTSGPVLTNTIGIPSFFTTTTTTTTEIAMTTKALPPITKWTIVIGAVGIFVGFLVVGGAVSCCILVCRRLSFSSSNNAYSSHLDFSSEEEEMFDDLPVTPSNTIHQYDLEEDDDPIFINNENSATFDDTSIYSSIPAGALRPPVVVYHGLPHK